jgi:uncharacterized protein (DUF2141 family)
MKPRLNLSRKAFRFMLCYAAGAALTASLVAQTPTAPAPAQATPAQTAPAPAAPAPAGAAPAQTTPAQGNSALTVRIKGIRNAKGKIDVVLYNKGDGFPMDPTSAIGMKQVDIDSKTMTATVVFDKLAEGVYAATVLHDENLVGKMEFDAQGTPIEGYGISNNPDSSSGPPSWEASKFTVNQAGAAIEIAMIYWQ